MTGIKEKNGAGAEMPAPFFSCLKTGCVCLPAAGTVLRLSFFNFDACFGEGKALAAVQAIVAGKHEGDRDSDGKERKACTLEHFHGDHE